MRGEEKEKKDVVEKEKARDNKDLHVNRFKGKRRRKRIEYQSRQDKEGSVQNRDQISAQLWPSPMHVAVEKVINR